MPGAESHYEWRGKRERTREVLLLIKARAQTYRRIETLIRENHSYKTPEVIALPIQRGSRDYLKWIRDQTGGASKA